jgi:osmotically-inducible protein OsmY
VTPTCARAPRHRAPRIFDAFRRSGELEACRIGVDARDGKVALHGTLNDYTEVRAAERAAWSVPGVIEVENRLTVVP